MLAMLMPQCCSETIGAARRTKRAALRLFAPGFSDSSLATGMGPCKCQVSASEGNVLLYVP